MSSGFSYKPLVPVLNYIIANRGSDLEKINIGLHNKFTKPEISHAVSESVRMGLVKQSEDVRDGRIYPVYEADIGEIRQLKKFAAEIYLK